MTIRVTLMMQDGVFRDALAFRIAAEEDLTATDLAGVERLTPHVALVELRASGGAISTVEELRRSSPAAEVLIALPRPSPYLISEALRIGGVRGCLCQKDSLSEWLKGIRRAAVGQNVFSASVRSQLTFDPTSNEYTLQSNCVLMDLTPRQLEVLRQVGLGLSTRKIGELLGLAEKSVETHKYRLSGRLGIHDRVQLARLAIREGLVEA